MSKHVTPLKDRVPLGQKAAFGAGHLVNNLLPGALGVFAFFLLTAFGMMTTPLSSCQRKAIWAGVLPCFFAIGSRAPVIILKLPFKSGLYASTCMPFDWQ